MNCLTHRHMSILQVYNITDNQSSDTKIMLKLYKVILILHYNWPECLT